MNLLNKNKKVAKPVFSKTCEYCGNLFKSDRPDTMYCKPGCRVMASRKGFARHRYPNQLERALENHVIEYIRQLKGYSGNYIDPTQYYKLEHECEVILALTASYVDHENNYFRLLNHVVRPIFPKDNQPIWNKEGTHILFKLDDQTFNMLAKYDPYHTSIPPMRQEL